MKTFKDIYKVRTGLILICITIFHTNGTDNYKYTTCTEHWAAMTPSTGDSANGSKLRSARLIKSGFSK